MQGSGLRALVLEAEHLVLLSLCSDLLELSDTHIGSYQGYRGVVKHVLYLILNPVGVTHYHYL